MMKTDFTIENKLPVSAVFYLIIVSIKSAVKELWAVLALGLVSQRIGLSLFFKIIIAILAIVVFAVLRGILMYKNFTYIIQNNELVVKKGVFKKTTLSIPLHKIQNVSTTQGFWQQMLDITTLSVDTAGSKTNELEIFLDIETSENLKEYLFATKKEKQLYTEYPTETVQNETTEVQDVKKTYFYDTQQLLLAALSRNHLKSISIFFAIFFTLFNQLGERYQENLINSAVNYIPQDKSVSYWIIIVLIILIISISINFIISLLKYYNLSVKLYPKKIAYHTGLIKQMDQVINLSKIQVIEETENVLEKSLKVSSLKIHQFFDFAENAKNQVSFFLPGFRKSSELTSDIYPEIIADEFSEIHSKKNLFFRNIYFFVLPATLLFGVLSFFDIRSLILLLITSLFMLLVAFLRYKRSRAEVGKAFIRIYSGTFGQKISTLKIKNIQSVQLKQSIFQQRSKTASLLISTRWLSLKMPFIHEWDARMVSDYLLFRLETDKDTKVPEI